MGFRLKTILGVAIIEILLVISLITTGLQWLKNSNEQELQSRAHSIVELLAATAKDAVLSYDMATLESFVGSAIQSEGIAYIRIYNGESLLAKAGDPALLAAPFVQDYSVDGATDGIYDESHEISEGSLHDIAGSGDIIGRIELGMSTREFQQVISDARRMAPGIALIGILLSALFSFFLGTYLTSRLRLLRQAAGAISEGDVGHQIDIGGRDELAQTARSFNHMSLRLKESYDKMALSLEKSRDMALVLHESELYTNAIIDHVADAIISTDSLGTIESVNIAFTKIFGYDSHEMIGKNINILIPGSTRSAHDKLISDFLQRGVMKSIILEKKRELFGLHKDGSEIPVELAISPVRLTDDLMFVALIRDITDRREVENTLIRSRRDAEAASVAKSEFLANMSHEIRTPMNGVIGMLQLLNKTSMDGIQQKYVGTAMNSADLLLHIINDILDFSKIEAGKLQLEIIDFNLRQIVEDAAELLSGQVKENDVELLCYISEDVPAWLFGDPSRLSQIIMNLGSNALKFTRKGEVSIHVEVKQTLDKECCLHFEVRDSGIGIEPEHQAKLFQPFEQADGSTNRRFGGTGLGLSISRQLVSFMRGEIGVNSVPGEGSTFWFDVVLGESARQDENDHAALEGKHILIVDDNQTNLTIMHNYLKNVGVDVHEVTDGYAATAAVERAAAHDNPYDAILLDMQMPGMDGIETAKRIHQIERTRYIPQVLVSSLGQIENIPSSAGIGLCLSKPIRQHHFLDCIANMVDPQSAAANKTSRQESAQTQQSWNARILLVEDNIVNQQVAMEMLRLVGLVPELAEDGREAVETFKNKQFDLVLMDCQMPVMDGFEATRLIREREQAENLSPTPVLALTANAMQTDIERCEAAGMDDHIPKPVSEATLHKMLTKWLPTETASEVPVATFAKPVTATPDRTAPTKGQDDPDLHVDVKKYNDLHAQLGDRLFPILDMFKENGEELITRMDEDIRTRNATDLVLNAHTMKGSSAAIAASKLTSCFAELEAQAKKDDLSKSAELLAAISKEFQSTLEALNKLSTEHKKTA